MRSSKLVVLLAVVAAAVFASVISASASPGGTVYGEATMQPTVSLVLSGAGSEELSPLVYSGRRGEQVWENNMGRVTIANNGEVGTPVFVGRGSDPTDGNTTWQYSTSQVSPNECVWMFLGNVAAPVPSEMGSPSLLLFELAPGDFASVGSEFQFPTTFDGNPHSMNALIIAGGVQ